MERRENCGLDQHGQSPSLPHQGPARHHSGLWSRPLTRQFPTTLCRQYVADGHTFRGISPLGLVVIYGPQQGIVSTTAQSSPTPD